LLHFMLYRLKLVRILSSWPVERIVVCKRVSQTWSREEAYDWKYSQQSKPSTDTWNNIFQCVFNLTANGCHEIVPCGLDNASFPYCFLRILRDMQNGLEWAMTILQYWTNPRLHNQENGNYVSGI
jgi:hypothetical protein